MPFFAQGMLQCQLIECAQVYSRRFIDIGQMLACSLAPLQTTVEAISLVRSCTLRRYIHFGSLQTQLDAICRSMRGEHPFSMSVVALHDALV